MRLRIAYIEEPPFYWTAEGGAVTGADIELADAVLRAIGAAAIEYVPTSFDEFLPGVQERRFRQVAGRSGQSWHPRCAVDLAGHRHRGMAADRRPLESTHSQLGRRRLGWRTTDLDHVDRERAGRRDGRLGLRDRDHGHRPLHRQRLVRHA
jgi:ABC-type amino acid transport substrate-binding protein